MKLPYAWRVAATLRRRATPRTSAWLDNLSPPHPRCARASLSTRFMSQRRVNVLPTEGDSPPRPPGLLAKTALICALLLLGTLAVYWPVVGFDFTDYDDPGFISANPHVLSGLKPENVAWAFQTTDMGYWQPLTWLSLMLDVQLFGTGAAGPHATNLILHAANSILLFLLLRRMTAAHWRSALVAGLFALHPLRVESVAWVCERKDVLSTCFGLLALLAYHRHVAPTRAAAGSAGFGRKATRAYWLALLWFLLSLMSKPMLVTLPFALLLLDYWPLGRIQLTGLRAQRAILHRLLLEKLPFLFLSAVFSAATFLVANKIGAVVPITRLPALARLENAAVSYVVYLAKTFWPVNLANPYAHSWTWPVSYVLLAGALLAGLSALIVWRARRLPFFFTGWFWFLGTFVPVIGLVQTGEQPMADRFTYVPLIGLFILLVWGGAALLARWPSSRPVRVMAGIIPTVVLVALGLRSTDQLQYWRNSEVMFRRAVAVTTGNHIAHNNLGAILWRQGQRDQAVNHYAEALRFKPDFAEALNNLGATLVARGQFAEARTQFTRALEIKPSLASAHSNLGDLFSHERNTPAAIAAYQRALELDPKLPDVHNNLACALAARGDLPAALAHFQQAVALRPDFVDALNNLGTTLSEQGRAAEALGPLTNAIRLHPAYAEAHYNLANAYLALKRPRDAAAEYQAALQLHPNHGPAHYRLGNLYFLDHQLDAAAQHYRAALAGNTNHAEAHYQLATVLAEQKVARPAVGHYREALRLKPDWLEPLNNLAWMLATHPASELRDGAEAVRLANRALELTHHRDSAAFDTLAAAYAEAGRFSEAIAAAQHALTLAPPSTDPRLTNDMRNRLELYQQGRPYREPR